MSKHPLDVLFQLPEKLPSEEAYYYLSVEQRSVCLRYIQLACYVDFLPCWVPHRHVADALGHSHYGIENAIEKCGGKPYVWGTEFENVHSFWSFVEPRFEVNGVYYNGSEAYYQAQKPYPFDAALWDVQRDEVMRKAIECKFNASPALLDLLLSTGRHPLLSIKFDSYWGVNPSGEGENKLGVLLMELRDSMRVV